MKKNNTLLIIILLVIIAVTILAIFLPTSFITERIPYFTLYNNTVLTITTTNCKAKIDINAKAYGETNKTISDLPEGNYQVELTRIEKGTPSNFYKPHKFALELTRNTESIINIEIGPEDFIGGYVLYYTPTTQAQKNDNFLTVKIPNNEANIFIDDKFIQTSPMLAYEAEGRGHVLRIEAEGYETQEIPIITREGYNLNIESYLLPVPTSNIISE